jgi:hypothetical protein
MSAYHKKADQSIEKSAYPLPMEQLTLSDLREAVKGRFSSFCTAVGIQALVTLMDQDVESMAGRELDAGLFASVIVSPTLVSATSLIPAAR